MTTSLKEMIKVLDAKATVKIYTNREIKGFEVKVYQLYDCNEDYMNWSIEDFYINVDTLVVLLNK